MSSSVEIAFYASLLIVVLGLTYLTLFFFYKRKTRTAVQTAQSIAEDRAHELQILKNLAETLNQTLPPEKALEAGLTRVANQVGATSGWLLTLTTDHKADLAAGYNLPPNMELAQNGNRPWALCNCMKSTLANELQVPTRFECERLKRTPELAENDRFHISTPIRASGVPVGILNLTFPAEHAFGEVETRLLAAVGDQFGGAVERVRLFKEVHKLAITDPLTGLYNRRHFSAMLVKEMERSRRYQRPISLAILDIDHFKLINDTFGHMAGDQALQEVARICQEAIRRIDLVGRFGGEEMTILMPETTTERAEQAMERLRGAVETLEINTPRGTARITVSIGLTSMEPNENIDFNHLLDRADQALYQAKNNGRNQVRVL
ncbi:MAG TPA: sensor domain-containing diguanylate cyclase [Anaerolineaceae bacterium]